MVFDKQPQVCAYPVTESEPNLFPVFKTLYGGQFTLSTQLTKPNYPKKSVFFICRMANWDVWDHMMSFFTIFEQILPLFFLILAPKCHLKNILFHRHLKIYYQPPFCYQFWLALLFYVFTSIHQTEWIYKTLE